MLDKKEYIIINKNSFFKFLVTPTRFTRLLENANIHNSYELALKSARLSHENCCMKTDLIIMNKSVYMRKEKLKKIEESCK